jgi:hypothetical protein
VTSQLGGRSRKIQKENPEGNTIYAGVLSQTLSNPLHQRRFLAKLKHPCPTLICAIRTCGL